MLAARREQALRDVAEACRTLGAECDVLPTDVTDERAVAALAQHAVARHGRIDVWVNNAGVTAFGMLEEVPSEVHRRVIETNVFGSMHGAREVLPIFKKQRSGVLINVGSILGKVGQPYVPAYVISKFALQGLTATLRSALADEPNIHVCSFLPYAVDTPHFESGANDVGLDPRAMPPTQKPVKVARALVRLAERPRRELVVPRYARIGLFLSRLFPKSVERATLHLTREWHSGHELERPTDGNLYSPRKRTGRVRASRRPRTSFLRMLAWGAVHFLRLAPHGGGDHMSTRPHALPS